MDAEPSDQELGPFPTLVKAFASYGELDYASFSPLSQYMSRIHAQAGDVIWCQGDAPDGLYVIESGVLRAKYKFSDRDDYVEESMVGGTLAGELTALSDLPRNATVSVEQDAVLWKFSSDDRRKLETENPELARMFAHLILKGVWNAQHFFRLLLMSFVLSCKSRL